MGLDIRGEFLAAATQGEQRIALLVEHFIEIQ